MATATSSSISPGMTVSVGNFTGSVVSVQGGYVYVRASNGMVCRTPASNCKLVVRPRPVVHCNCAPVEDRNTVLWVWVDNVPHVWLDGTQSDFGVI